MKKLNKEQEPAISDLVLLKNNQFLVFNKPNGLEVQGGKSEEKALKNLAEIYAKAPVFVVHRLDRPASGLTLIARSSKAQTALSEQFKNRTVEKYYLAITKNAPPHSVGTLKHHLKQVQHLNKSFVSDPNDKNAKEAILDYEVIGSSEVYNFLKIRLITGRHHQIRAQLAAIDCPIKGDVKYGFRRGNKDRSIHLHAWKMRFEHPVSKATIDIEAPLPDEVLWNLVKAII